MKVQQFVFGKGTTPAWFEDLCREGRAKIVRDDEGEVVKAVLYTPGGTREASIGDSIVYVPSGLAVVPADKARQYGLQPKESKEKAKDAKVKEEKKEIEEKPEDTEVADETVTEEKTEE